VLKRRGSSSVQENANISSECLLLFVAGKALELQPDFLSLLVMAALRCRCGHYIFVLWFLASSFFFSSPNLSRRTLDVYHTSTHGVALVRI